MSESGVPGRFAGLVFLQLALELLHFRAQPFFNAWRCLNRIV